MWIFMNDAMLSIVQLDARVTNQRRKKNLMVRARLKGDIERVFPHATVSRTLDRDYAYRAIVPRETVAEAICEQVMGIDYGNFKDSVGKQDHLRHHAYLQVWTAMYQAQAAARLGPVNRRGVWKDEFDL